LGPDFLQFSGDDLTALACMAAGAHGCISVVSNLVPRLCADLHKECLQNRFDAALAVQDRLTPLCLAVFLEAGVTGAKYGLSLLGKCAEDVRLPLVPIIEPARQAVRDALAYASVSR
jgi:4-hydroxy-tetrahydrodipicolinate synthase